MKYCHRNKVSSLPACQLRSPSLQSGLLQPPSLGVYSGENGERWALRPLRRVPIAHRVSLLGAVAVSKRTAVVF